MTTRLLLAILVVLSLAASGCSSNRRMCRRATNYPPSCYCCSPAPCNCGCNSCGMTSCSMGGCSTCDGGSCPCSGGSPMMSGYGGGEMVEGASFGPPEGGYFGSSGTPACNCGAQ